MPIEIRELQITTVVEDQPTATTAPSVVSAGNTDAIVSACVEQVLEILKQKNER